jgi:ankyrin repeat protein
MRLLERKSDDDFTLTKDLVDNIPPYAILSHTWGVDTEEVTFRDVIDGTGKSKAGYGKIRFCADQARCDGIQYFWVDTCCIDKSSSAELTEAINSMFRWYREAARCYVYLSDVSTGDCVENHEPLRSTWESGLRKSRWFTRGWTLQELLAPPVVEFFSSEGKRLGTRISMVQQIHEITGVHIQALQGSEPFSFSVAERMSWAKNRETTREEDQAYCLMGIFGVHLPVIYGEREENASKRLREEIDKLSEELKCPQALRTSEYEQFKDRNPGRLEGTCKWFLQHNCFQDWQQSRSGLLWVSADPGCGKSVLAKSLIDQEIKSTRSRTTCYFFFKDDNDKQKSLTTALSSLLHQLLSQKQSLIQHAMQDYKTEGNYLPHSIYKLWGILTKAASDSEAGEIICVLDALDECAEAERYQIIDTLSTFYKQTQRCSQLKFLITSRPYFDIERKFANLIGRFPTIRLRGERETEAISREIDIVIRSRVSELGQELELDDSEQSILRDQLLAMEHRTYLWLKLIVDVIREEIDPSKKRLERIVNTLPATVDQAYEAILSKSKDQRRVQKLLHIIVAAIRPLTVQEMNIALAIEDHHSSYEDLDLNVKNEARSAATIRNLCGLFVNIIDQRVYLIHHTAKEFLIAKDGALLGSWKQSLSPGESELLMTRICITYLMFTIFRDPFIKNDLYYYMVDDSYADAIIARYNTAIKQQVKIHGYLEYAANFWGTHYKKAQSKISDVILQSALPLYDTRSWQFQNWFTIFEYMNNSILPSNNIMVASCFGHETVVKVLLKTNAKIESKDNNGQTPLLRAAEKGHEAVVKVLLEAKANVELKDNNGQTPLLRAAANRNEAVVKVLLEAKADVESKDKWNRTPLWWATTIGDGGIVKLLLESKDNNGQTPLSRAAEKGHEAAVKVLLEAKANIESKDKWSRTPLSWATTIRGGGVVKLLLEANAEIESTDNNGQTPLSRAAEKGHEAIVKVLLEANAEIESKDNNGQTPLSRGRRERARGRCQSAAQGQGQR